MSMDFDVDANVDPINTPFPIVREDGSVKGIAWFEDFINAEDDADHPRTVDEISEPLEPHQILSSSTTILEAVEIFGSRRNRYFYVFHVDKITGVIFYSDLFKPLGRLAFLALALEIEDDALSLCRSPEVSDRCWNSLSLNRKDKAVEVFRRRYRRGPELHDANEDGRLVSLCRGHSDLALLIACTHLVDKATMLWKQRLVPGKEAEVLGFFNDLKEIRDKCAHPRLGEDELLPKEQLASFVNSAKRMRESLREARSGQVIVPPGHVLLDAV